MNTEARIDLSSEDFVLSSSRKPQETNQISRKVMGGVWDICHERLNGNWGMACRDLEIDETPCPLEEMEKALAGMNLRKISLDDDLVGSLQGSIGLENLMRSSALRDRSTKCLQSVRNLSDEAASEDRVSSFNGSKQDELFCVGIRYLLPLAVAIEDFGADGVYNCAALMREISSSYQAVAYHNGSHASLVTHHSVEICKLSGIWRCFNDSEKTALIIAAAGHDIGHPGLGASLFLKSGHPLAIIYNDKHVLENYHAARLIQILIKHNYRPVVQGGDLKFLIIQCILWTDLSDHQRVMMALQSTLAVVRKSHKRGDELIAWLKRPSNKSILRDLAALVVKISDLSYFALENPAHMIKWTIWLYAELYTQRGIESENNLPLCEAYGVNGLGTRKWFEANLNFCTDVLMPMTICLASFESRLNKIAEENNPLSSTNYPIKTLKDHKQLDWHSTALAIRQHDKEEITDLKIGAVYDMELEGRDSKFEDPKPGEAKSVEIKSGAKKNTEGKSSTVKTAARWLAQQSNTVKQKGTAAIQNLLQDSETCTNMTNMHQAVIVPLLNNMELLKKAKYANGST